MLGSRVEVDVHVIHGQLNRLQNAIRVVKGLQLEVDDIVFSGLASSLALLTNEQKELGALVIDIGGGATEYVVCAGGIIKHTGVLAVGGDHVSNDLAYGLKLRLSRAEQLKLEHGSALLEDSAKGQLITLADDLGTPAKVLSLENLRRIMSLRLEEIFQLVAQDLENAGALEFMRGGVYLCGGVSRVSGIAELAERVFQTPVTVGKTNSISGLKSALDQPEFATAIGLVKFGSFQQRKRAAKQSLTAGLKQTLGRIFRNP
jgi:cell division protein FtsA